MGPTGTSVIISILLAGSACSSDSESPRTAPSLKQAEDTRREAAGSEGATPPAARPDAGSAVWQPLPASERYAGRTLSEWAVEWCRWSYAQTDCAVSTSDDPDGSACGAFQDEASPVFFVDTGMPITKRTKCVVPAGKAIVVPIADLIADNAGVPSEQQLTPQALRSLVQETHDSMRDLYLALDGVAIEDLTSWSIEPTELTYTLPDEPNWYTCHDSAGVTGTVSPAYFAGFFVVLPPPPPGQHALEYAGTLTLYGRDTSAHVKLTFTVE